MTTKHNRQRILSAVAAIAIVAVLGNAGRSRPGNAARHEVLTAQQAAERTAPICRLLATGQRDLRQVTEAMDRVGWDGVKHKIWVVDCIDGHGDHSVHTVWDAETGNLIVAAHGPRRGTKNVKTKENSNNAANTAWNWMEALGVVHIAQHWTMPHSPTIVGTSWIVTLCSPKYDATVILDKDTHDLVYLTVKELPPAHAS